MILSMNLELNTPRNQTAREQYIKELINVPEWGRVGMFSDASGWRPGPNLRKRLLLEEFGHLTTDIRGNKKRIAEWTTTRAKIKSTEEQQKLSRSISRWESYNQALARLREDVKAAL